MLNYKSVDMMLTIKKNYFGSNFNDPPPCNPKPPTNLLKCNFCWFFTLKLHLSLPLELGNLPKSGIIAEIKRLYDEGYQLGLDEGKEITRGKYLNIFATGAMNYRKK